MIYYATNRIPEFWQDARPWIEKSCTKTNCGFSVEHVLKSIVIGTSQIWMAEKDGEQGFIVTKIENRPLEKIGMMTFGAGSLIDMADILIPEIKKFFIQNDCTIIEMLGRHGWEPKMKQHDMQREFAGFRGRL